MPRWNTLVASIFSNGGLELKVATSYLVLEQPSESTARCRMVGVRDRAPSVSPRTSRAPLPCQPWPCLLAADACLAARSHDHYYFR